MKTLISKAKAAWARVPASVKTEAKHVALTFAATFAAVAGPLLPEIVRTPSIAAAKALLVAAVAAGARAAYPVAKAAIRKLIARAVASRV